ncbi:MAG: tRNA (adenosine(37)-N6)-threonylcarbamoyltransferase complex dimerization subunit type 1 TsaB, partial [Elusimicrobia bacterium]|nr:tRNA (adenosine(37)-N6)-threonylcarbamoyltransferase complex dimerization subunit type 1 TsaB [Elusimicrobiota bacterium]
MITLAIDTCGDTLKIAARYPDGKIKTASKKHIKQEEYLFPLIKKLLGVNQLKDISKIAVLRGPGRFTGIRIGLTFANLMNRLNGSKVSAPTTFEALAFQTVQTKAFLDWTQKNPRGEIACVIHAFRDEFFCQLFSAKATSADEPKWFALEELNKYLSSQKNPLYCVGWGGREVALEGFIVGNYCFAPQKHCALKPSSIIK